MVEIYCDSLFVLLMESDKNKSPNGVNVATLLAHVIYKQWCCQTFGNTKRNHIRTYREIRKVVDVAEMVFGDSRRLAKSESAWFPPASQSGTRRHRLDSDTNRTQMNGCIYLLYASSRWPQPRQTFLKSRLPSPASFHFWSKYSPTFRLLQYFVCIASMLQVFSLTFQTETGFFLEKYVKGLE